MIHHYLIIDCEEGKVTGTKDRGLAEWYSNGDYTLVVDLAQGAVLMGNETLNIFEERPIEEAEDHRDEYGEMDD